MATSCCHGNSLDVVGVPLVFASAPGAVMKQLGTAENVLGAAVAW